MTEGARKSGKILPQGIVLTSVSDRRAVRVNFYCLLLNPVPGLPELGEEGRRASLLEVVVIQVCR